MLLTQEKMIWKSFVTIIKSQSRDDKERFKAIIITLCVEWAYYHRDSIYLPIFTRRSYDYRHTKTAEKYIFQEQRQKFIFIIIVETLCCAIFYQVYKLRRRPKHIGRQMSASMSLAH